MSRTRSVNNIHVDIPVRGTVLPSSQVDGFWSAHLLTRRRKVWFWGEKRYGNHWLGKMLYYWSKGYSSLPGVVWGIVLVILQCKFKKFELSRGPPPPFRSAHAIYFAKTFFSVKEIKMKLWYLNILNLLQIFLNDQTCI